MSLSLQVFYVLPITKRKRSTKAGLEYMDKTVELNNTASVEIGGDLHDTISLYMAMINAVPAMTYLKDIDHKYILANEAFCKFVGKPLKKSQAGQLLISSPSTRRKRFIGLKPM